MDNFLEVCFLLSLGAIAAALTTLIIMVSCITILSASKEFERLLGELNERS